ncbi:phosphotransferase family protein [Acidiphilium sp. AL]|uniref:choline/ethanolamine kinase family protein n=1 Tax=Acidiphilium sp. AL TaxID=2871704 RepID=UPI0021CB91CF|nr:choline/ethanolamine kinase family protein [Acidiphilium sp. AL]MCU4161087.1 phosphotransferase family protein [Acidiphilium sp. AL]
MTDPQADIDATIASLPCWTGRIAIAPLEGGITNRNYLVTARGERFVVRFGTDNPAHGIWRVNELAAARAGFAAGISPEVVHAAPGVMVSRFIAGRTLAAADFTDPAMLRAAIALLRRCHAAMAAHLDIPAVLFWVFHVNRAYLRRLRSGACRIADRLDGFAALNTELERRTGPVTLAFCHNDLLAANWIDDGARLWLIDWDYGGFNTPLFDLANLAANASLAPDTVLAALADYDGAQPDKARSDAFAALIAASLLRELLWSAVSEQDPPTDFDYAAYTETYARRLAEALAGLGIAEPGTV